MPKVTQEYIIHKKKLIVDAAYGLCLKKTISNITIINETGLSQGGIYRFYKDMDEILADMIDRLRTRSQFREKLDAILSHAEELPFQETIGVVFDLLGSSMEDGLLGTEKIDFELSILAMNAPKRVDTILSKTKVCGNKEYLSWRTMELFKEAVSEGRLHILIPVEELFSYIASVYSGIQMTCIVNSCYHSLSEEERKVFGPLVQMHLLAQNVLQYVK